MLFNEPKLLKFDAGGSALLATYSFSALQRAEIAEMRLRRSGLLVRTAVSVLFNEPKLLKSYRARAVLWRVRVSVLFNEPKLLKSRTIKTELFDSYCFSALQRAEIAEM